MNRIILFLLVVCNCIFSISFSQSTSVTYGQQTSNYNSLYYNNGGDFYSTPTQLGLWANGAGTASQVVAWRPFTTDGSITPANKRSLQIGDQFVISGSFTRAYGRIGISLLSSPSSEASWADAQNNYALQVNLDGPDYTGSFYGDWYLVFNGGATAASSFGGNQGTFNDYSFTFTVTAPNRMNVTVTDITSGATYTVYDVLLNSSNPITDYSIYLQNDYDGNANQNFYFGLPTSTGTSITNTGTIAIGASNTSFSISGILADAFYTNQNSGSTYSNALSMTGTGTVTLTGQNTYTGLTTVSNGTLQFNHAGGNTIPVTNNVSVNAGGTLQISSNQTLNNLSLASGATLIIDNGVTLTINGTFLQNGGTVTNNGTIFYGTSAILNYGAAQTTGAELTATVPNLTISAGSGNTVTLNSAVIVTGTVNPTSGTLATGGYLTLAAAVGNNASITQGSGSYLSGNVTIQRYIGSSQQWRMIGFPFTSSSTISNSQLPGMYSSPGNAYTYNEAADDELHYGSSGASNAGWTAFTSGSVPAYQGLLLIGGVPGSTLNLTGTVNTGTTLTALTKSKNGWNFIANPFASNIDWTSIASNNASLVNNAIYRYDPNTTAYATYVNNNSTGNQSHVIENGAGFFVQAIAAGNLSISESDKTTAAVVASLMGIGTQRGTLTPDGTVNAPVSTATSDEKSILQLSLSKQGDLYADEAIVRWGVDPATDNFDGKYDAYDMGRAVGPDLSVVGNDGSVYSIFHGSALQTKDKEQRAIALGVKNMQPGTYTISSKLLSPMYDGNEIYLIDHYNNQTALISKDTAGYIFQVTADPASASVSRFSIAFNYKQNMATSNNSIQLLNNPSSLNQFNIVLGADYKQVNWELIDISGRVIQSGVFSGVTKGTVNIAQTHNLVAGNYFIKLTGDSKILPTQKWIKE